MKIFGSGALLTIILAATSVAAARDNYYVSPTGNDGNSGSRAAPFATVPRARDAVRAALARPGGLPEGAVVWIASGDYQLRETLELTAADSGRAGAPIVYRSVGSGVPRLLGSMVIDPASWKPLAESTRKRVHPKVDPAVLRELDLTGLGLTRTRQFAPGSHFTDQWFTIDLFANGQRQPLSHWPNPTENIRGVNDPGWTTCNGSKSPDAFFYGAGGQPDDKGRDRRTGPRRHAPRRTLEGRARGGPRNLAQGFLAYPLGAGHHEGRRN